MVQGKILTSSDPEYKTARCVYNGMVDRYPALIVRCVNVKDVQVTISFARDHGLPLAVRAGGHSAAGFSVCDGGLVIDLSLMKDIHIDPVQRVARAHAGLTWGEFDKGTQAFGLATTGGRISSTGIAGVTLGGGYGWLMRKHGLAIDNLLSVNLVTSDGRALKASSEENSDLFWAVRGGGGNFGIATSFEYQLHPIGPEITGGMVFYSITRAREILGFYRDFMLSAPDELSALCNLLIMPPIPFVPAHLHGVPVVAIAICHVGPLRDAQHDLAALQELGKPLVERIRPMSYLKLQRMYDAAGVFGNCIHGRSGHLANLTDEALDCIAFHAARITSPLSIVMVSRLGGAVSHTGECDTAFGWRNTAFDVAINSVWTDAQDSARHIQWTEDFWSAMRPFSRGVYVNELGDEGAERIREAYNSSAWRRLIALKNTWDSSNLLRLNQNIPPTS